MRAYKFLSAGAVGPFSRVAWPRPDDGTPGPWLDAAGPRQRCVTGVHACRATDLPHWLSHELWEVELGDPVEPGPTKLVASAGRLLARVSRWDAEMAIAYAAACAARVGMADYAQDAAGKVAAARADPSRAAVLAADAAFIAVTAADRSAGDGAAERAWQAQWLIARLGLELEA